MASLPWIQRLAALGVALATLLGGPVHEVLLHGVDPLVGGGRECCGPEVDHGSDDDGTPEARGHGHDDHGPCGLCSLVGRRAPACEVTVEAPAQAGRVAPPRAGARADLTERERERPRGPPAVG